MSGPDYLMLARTEKTLSRRASFRAACWLFCAILSSVGAALNPILFLITLLCLVGVFVSLVEASVHNAAWEDYMRMVFVSCLSKLVGIHDSASIVRQTCSLPGEGDASIGTPPCGGTEPGTQEDIRQVPPRLED